MFIPILLTMRICLKMFHKVFMSDNINNTHKVNKIGNANAIQNMRTVIKDSKCSQYSTYFMLVVKQNMIDSIVKISMIFLVYSILTQFAMSWPSVIHIVCSFAMCIMEIFEWT